VYSWPAMDEVGLGFDSLGSHGARRLCTAVHHLPTSKW
jgi:hypothetical protein